MIAGVTDAPPQQVMTGKREEQSDLYSVRAPHWEQISYAYKSNTPAVGCARSCTQQELKWGLEILADELAGLDPIEFRLRNVASPSDRLDPAVDLAHPDEEARAGERRPHL